MGAKADKIESQNRVNAVQGWIVDGVPSTLIIQQIMFKGWVKTERSAYRILLKAREEWIKYEDNDREKKRRMMIQQLKNRIRGMGNQYKNTPAGMRVILQYEMQIAKLEGLHFLSGFKDDDDVLPPPAAPAPFEQVYDITFKEGEVAAIAKQLEDEY